LLAATDVSLPWRWLNERPITTAGPLVGSAMSTSLIENPSDASSIPPIVAAPIPELNPGLAGTSPPKRTAPSRSVPRFHHKGSVSCRAVRDRCVVVISVPSLFSTGLAPAAEASSSGNTQENAPKEDARRARARKAAGVERVMVHLEEKARKDQRKRKITQSNFVSRPNRKNNQRIYLIGYSIPYAAR
jgi:hypothetical protein